jgi:hypothetical protein
MNRAAIAFLAALVVATTLQTTQANQDQELLKFWDDFKAAVNARNVDAVAKLTTFPLEMPYGIANVKSAVQLRKRYKAVFAQQSDAIACFRKAQPETDQQNPKKSFVACPDEAGNLVILYNFSKTKTGWKFIGLDNINE